MPKTKPYSTAKIRRMQRHNRELLCRFLEDNPTRQCFGPVVEGKPDPKKCRVCALLGSVGLLLVESGHQTIQGHSGGSYTFFDEKEEVPNLCRLWGGRMGQRKTIDEARLVGLSNADADSVIRWNDMDRITFREIASRIRLMPFFDEPEHKNSNGMRPLGARR